jgi:hypothetical protein
MLSTQRPPNSTPKHLLWGRLLLKQYNIESVNDVLVANKKIAKFKTKICKFENQCPHGTDFRILEPTEFDQKWFSHKFRGSGVRYEIGLCIATGNIVWAHGEYTHAANGPT